MANLTTLKQQLTEAETALHQLMLGNKVVEIRVNGRWMQKTAADAGSLRTYIKDLKSQINRLEGGASPRSPLSFHV